MIHFLLPVYNEEVNLDRQIETIATISKFLSSEFTIVAVDDGSRDGSVAKLEALGKTYPIQVLRHEVNQGPGAAFRTGFDHILKSASADSVIVTMDADNTHSTKTVGMILAGLEEGYEMVIASVFAPGGMMIGVPFLRYVLTLGCNFLYRCLFPVRGIREYTGFYRGYRVDALKTASQKLDGVLFSASGFGCMAELLVRLRSVPVFMKEVPMIVRYDQKGGVSKLKIGKTIREHLGILARNLFRRRVI